MFLPSAVIEWNKIGKNIRKPESLNILKEAFRNLYGHLQTVLITPITLKKLDYYEDISHLREYKFKNSFQDTVFNPKSIWVEDIETSSHYLLHCPQYLQESITLFNAVRHIDPNILDLNNAQLTEILLYGKEDLDNMNNTSTLAATIKCLIKTKWFDAQLFFTFFWSHGFNINIAFKIWFFFFLLFCFLLLSISQHIYVNLVIVIFFI